VQAEAISPAAGQITIRPAAMWVGRIPGGQVDCNCPLLPSSGKGNGLRQVRTRKTPFLPPNIMKKDVNMKK